MKLNNIRFELAKQEMTQGELASKLEVTKDTVSSWANNLRQPSLKKLYIIADAIGVPAPRLLKDVNPLAQTARPMAKPRSIANILNTLTRSRPQWHPVTFFARASQSANGWKFTFSI